MSALYYFPNAADIASARRTCQALEQAIAIGALADVPHAQSPDNQKLLGAAAELLGSLADGAVRQSAWDMDAKRRTP